MSKIEAVSSGSDKSNILIRERNKREQRRKKALSPEQRKEQVKKWTTFYRRNWNIYAKHELGIPLFFFQEVMLYLLGKSQIFYMMCSRGLSKSFLSALAAFIKCMLYPYSEVALTATTIKTAKKMVKNKMEQELCGKMSPKLKYFYDKGLISFTYGQEEIRVDFLFNNSWILILPEADSSRGERASMIIFEECRLMKQHMVDSVFMPMSRPRQAAYLLKEEYQGDTRLIEKCQTIYLTSTRYKFEWFWTRWRKVVNNSFNNKRIPYGVFAGDIFTAIKHNLKTVEDLEIAKDTMSEMEIRMEYFNEPIGEVENAFYKLESFKENAVIVDGFVPPTPEEYVLQYLKGEIPYFRDKKDEEKRIIFVDFAFADTVKKSQANDLTVIGCMSGYPNESYDKMFRNLDYMETYSGGKREESILRIRELFYLYGADYLVLDIRNGGSDRLIELTKPYKHEIMGIDMNGFGVVNDADLLQSFCEDTKAASIREATVDPFAIPVVIPVVGTAERNSNYHVAMRNALASHTIRFLVDEIVLKQEKSDDVDFLTLEPHALMRRMLGHIQTSLMMEEAVNLEQEVKNGFIKLIEKRSNFKDRIIATEYGNYLFYLLELKMIKEQQECQTNIDDWIIVV
jgi:hypothetical protein